MASSINQVKVTSTLHADRVDITGRGMVEDTSRRDLQVLNSGGMTYRELAKAMGLASTRQKRGAKTTSGHKS